MIGEFSFVPPGKEEGWWNILATAWLGEEEDDDDDDDDD
jgi:hypothetical protein